VRVYRGETSSPLTHTVKYGVETGVAIKAYGPHIAFVYKYIHVRLRRVYSQRASVKGTEEGKIAGENAKGVKKKYARTGLI